MGESIQDKIEDLKARSDNRKDLIITERLKIDEWLEQIKELQELVNVAMVEVQSLRVLRARDLGAIEALEEL